MKAKRTAVVVVLLLASAVAAPVGVTASERRTDQTTPSVRYQQVQSAVQGQTTAANGTTTAGVTTTNVADRGSVPDEKRAPTASPVG